ncbi:MAG: hypothetical protein KatS3mg032_0740 [Cyclobacteriaceae bacterium]|nr:MAG: hypothetical protein KatS3mg032_0740 [Cyclobacteriaceae bacterium]
MKTATIILFVQITVFSFVLGQQRKVRVPQGYGTLNEIIRNDTLANGQRKDPNTVYILKRGGVYVLSGTILASGFDLNIEAEEGSGPRPFIIMGFLTGATQVEESFKVFNNLKMKSLHITNVNEFNTYIARVISVDGPNARLEFSDCLIDRSGQTFIRLNSGGSKIFMRNCTVSRMGRPSNPDNGRVIDDRGNLIDSLVVENNTWYNVTSRVVRDGGGDINYARFNQNTFVNIGQRFAAIGGINKFYFNNNIVVNPRFYGNSPTSGTVSLEFNLVGESPVINLDYNNIYYTDAVINAWSYISSQQSTPVIRPPFVAPSNEIYINNASGLIEEQLNFINGPDDPSDIIIESELGESTNVPDWDWTSATSELPWDLVADAYHNFGYSSLTNSYSGSSSNEPLGDLRWFNGFEILWNLKELIKDASNLLQELMENDGIIAVNPAAITQLENEISLAQATADNPATNRSQTASAFNDLKQAIQNAKSSLIVTGIETLAENEIHLFPNPSSDYIYINNIDGKLLSVDVLNLDGVVLTSKKLSRGVCVVELLNYTPGVLVFKFILSNKQIVTKKIVKQ